MLRLYLKKILLTPPSRARAHEPREMVGTADWAIGLVAFNVGWWMDWPPMVLFGVLLAVTGLDLWDEK